MDGLDAAPAAPPAGLSAGHSRPPAAESDRLVRTCEVGLSAIGLCAIEAGGAMPLRPATATRLRPVRPANARAAPTSRLRGRPPPPGCARPAVRRGGSAIADLGLAALADLTSLALTGLALIFGLGPEASAICSSAIGRQIRRRASQTATRPAGKNRSRAVWSRSAAAPSRRWGMFRTPWRGAACA